MTFIKYELMAGSI